MTKAPFFSLVVATRGRSVELFRLFESLAAQAYIDFQVIVVDQNETFILSDLIHRDWPFAVHHFNTPNASGACRARNFGWRRATGTWVLFPDDDCWYPEDFLAFARDVITTSKCDVLTGRAADIQGTSINGRFETSPMWVSPKRVWTTSIEWVAFFTREQLQKIDGFDEGVGIGADSPWQSCESQDIVLRALASGGQVLYDPRLFGHHAELDVRNPNAALMRKGRAYARGLGWVLRKHHAPWTERLYWVARPVARSILSLFSARFSESKYQVQVALGRLEGARGRLSPLFGRSRRADQ